MGGMRSRRAATVVLDVALMCGLLPTGRLPMPGGVAALTRIAGRGAHSAAAPRTPWRLRQNRRMTSPDTAAERTTPADITAAVEASFAGCPDRRLREIMQALVRHLHAFVSEVGLSEHEWRAAIATLTATGHITDDHRQEFILWSDALGISMLVDALANARPPGATESTVLGPFYVPGAPELENGA